MKNQLFHIIYLFIKYDSKDKKTEAIYQNFYIL